MAKSGQSKVHRPQSEHASPSRTSGGWYPLELVCLDITKTERGQNSTQKPQPLHRSSMIWIIPWGIWMWSWSNGWRQNFMMAPEILLKASEGLWVSSRSPVKKVSVLDIDTKVIAKMILYHKCLKMSLLFANRRAPAFVFMDWWPHWQPRRISRQPLRQINRYLALAFFDFWIFIPTPQLNYCFF